MGHAQQLSLAERSRGGRLELLLTTDRRIRHQQNLRARSIALVVLTGSIKWSRVREHTEPIAATIAAATPGSYAEVDIPFEQRPGRA